MLFTDSTQFDLFNWTDALKSRTVSIAVTRGGVEEKERKTREEDEEAKEKRKTMGVKRPSEIRRAGLSVSRGKSNEIPEKELITRRYCGVGGGS